jgi:hypothetical protein
MINAMSAETAKHPAMAMPKSLKLRFIKPFIGPAINTAEHGDRSWEGLSLLHARHIPSKKTARSGRAAPSGQVMLSKGVPDSDSTRWMNGAFACLYAS